MLVRKTIFIFFIIFLKSPIIFGQTKWSFEFCGGVPFNFPSYIKIHQDGFNDLTIKKAKFYSEPFSLPPYWDWKFTHIKNNRLFELEAIHHKLYLKNKPSEITRFSISHGFNMFFLNYGKIDDLTFEINGNEHPSEFIFKFGIGAVFAHPETNIRGYSFEDPGEFLSTTYYLCGPAVNVSLGKRVYLLKRLFFHSEAKYTAAYTKIPISMGNAKLFTSTFQIIAGFGFDFMSKE